MLVFEDLSKCDRTSGSKRRCRGMSPCLACQNNTFGHVKHCGMPRHPRFLLDVWSKFQTSSKSNIFWKCWFLKNFQSLTILNRYLPTGLKLLGTQDKQFILIFWKFGLPTSTTSRVIAFDIFIRKYWNFSNTFFFQI